MRQRSCDCRLRRLSFAADVFCDAGGADQSADIRHLAVEIGLRRAEEAMSLVASFDPRSHLQPKAAFGPEEIFSAMTDHGTTP